MDRAPGLSVRLKLTLSYAGFLMLAGALLLAAVWVFLLRYVPDRALLVSAGTPIHGVFPIRSNLLHVFAPRAAAVLAFLLVFGLLGGWILAGRILAPLSLIAEEATETLLPLAEQRGLTIETSGDMTPTIGSHALLLQLSTNLVHNAIVHNLPEQGTVWITTSVHPKRVVLTVENTGEKLTPQLVSTLGEPFRRGTERIRTDHAGVGLGLAIVKSITQARDGTLTLTPRAAGGLRVAVQLPAAPPHTGR